MAKLITALDIGSAAIKGLVVEEKKDGSFSVIAAFKEPSAGLRRGVLADTEEATPVLRSIILDLQKISKKATQNIFTNLNGDHVKSRTSKGVAAVARADQEIQKDDVERAIQASRAVKISPNSIILHNITREFIVDEVGDIHDPVGMFGNRLEANTLIIEAFAPHIFTLTKCLERVGGRVSGIIFGPLAAARAVLSKRQKELGVLMIDFGFNTTSFAVYEENKVIHAKSLTLGSGYLTNDIAIGLKTPIEAAEKIKLTYGYALAKDVPRRETINLQEVDASLNTEVSKRFLSEVIEVRLAEILGFVNNELKDLGRSVQMPAGVVMVGGGVKLGGLADLVKQEVKLTARIGLPDLNKFEITNPAYHALLEDPEFSVAVGLILWGADNAGRTSSGNPMMRILRSLFP